MRVNASLILLVFVSSCSGIKSVQVRPPISPPPGLVWGYGVEKLHNNPAAAREAAYLKAIDDLLTRGPVLVSKTVEEHTTVIDVKSATRTMESSFRLKASRILQPSFMDAGMDEGFMWILVGTSEADIESGWQQFVQWRTEKIAQAQRLYTEAIGDDRLPRLEASMALLEDAGAQDDPSLIYYEVKGALDAAAKEAAELQDLQKQFRALTASGQLVAAEQALDQALRLGLPQATYDQYKLEVMGRRKEAAVLVSAGDDFFHDEQYKEALDRYQQASRLDRDNPQLPTKLAMAERYHKTARTHTVRSTVGAVGSSAGQIISSYFDYKREEERRKRAEAEAQEAKAKKEEKEKKPESKKEEVKKEEVAVAPSGETAPDPEVIDETINEKHERLLGQKQAP